MPNRWFRFERGDLTGATAVTSDKVMDSFSFVASSSL